MKRYSFAGLRWDAAEDRGGSGDRAIDADAAAWA